MNFDILPDDLFEIGNDVVKMAAGQDNFGGLAVIFKIEFAEFEVDHAVS